MSRYRALLHQQLVQYLDCKQETVTFVITVFSALHYFALSTAQRQEFYLRMYEVLSMYYKVFCLHNSCVQLFGIVSTIRYDHQYCSASVCFCGHSLSESYSSVPLNRLSNKTSDNILVALTSTIHLMYLMRVQSGTNYCVYRFRGLRLRCCPLSKDFFKALNFKPHVEVKVTVQ